ncbi:SDR family oxidoreductase [Novosphingobium bradum]|uniref:SDR family oxidoreductase n=1 Tax=Novosphingobium bradum TaxID=1737444 RepID=A0ABV7IM30_9SPHN
MSGTGLAIGSLFDVSGRRVLVTGGTAGLGLMIARAFVVNGARVFITGRDPARLAEAGAELAALGDCTAIPARLGPVAGAEALARDLAERTDRLDVLVNNAGMGWVAPFEEFPEAGWDKVFDLNLKTPFFLVQQLLPLLKAAAREDRWARVINLSSVSARSTGPATLVYGASKAAVEQMTRGMAKVLAPHRVLVNAIAPGFFPSRANDRLPDGAAQAWMAGAAVGRLGTAEDIGGLAIFLASRAGAFVDGQVIDIEGGRLGG